MILFATSAWVEHLRVSASVTDLEVRRIMLHERDELVMCAPVAMQLLAGAGRPIQLAAVEALLASLPWLSLDPVEDFRSAGALQRAARRSGRTVRSLVDCLIAAVALRHDAELVHQDVDFVLLAEVSPLRHRSLLG